MAFAQCPWPVWNQGNLTECFQQEFLRVLLPSIVVSISLLLLVAQLISQSRNNASQSTIINLNHHGFSGNAEEAGYDETPTNHSRCQYVDIIEALFIIAVVTVDATAFTLKAYESRPRLTALSGLITWLYVLALAALPLVFATPRRRMLKLRNHLAVIYTLQWLFKLTLFWSTITQAQPRLPQAITIFEFFLSTVLFIAAITRKSNTALSPVEGVKPPREYEANLLSQATFSWVYELIRKRDKSSLSMQDVWDLAPEDKASSLHAEADFQLLKKSTRLLRRLIYRFRSGFLRQFVYSFFSAWLSFAPILLLRAFLECMENPDGESRTAMWLYVILLSLAQILRSVLEQRVLWIGFTGCYSPMRVIVVGDLYTKALRKKAWTELDDSSKIAAPAKVGTITNLMSVDSSRVAQVGASLNELISSVPALIGSIILLWRILGPSSILSLVVMIGFTFINILFSKKINQAQKRVLTATDNRMQVTSESLQNMKFVKFFALETLFIKMVSEKRYIELKARRRFYYMWIVLRALQNTLPIVVTCQSFLLYTLVEMKPLYASVAFAVASLYITLQQQLDGLVNTIRILGEAEISANRIDEFLKEPETGKYKPDADGQSIELIENFNFQIGKLNIIAGPTGSGKTTILMALLGEIRTRGVLSLSGRVAYCAQQPWLLNTSIQSNILFGSPMDEERYERVLTACALKRDLESFEFYDQTQVGEKGTALSGGQKQRIALARAIYSNTGHILLDDSLSAVDSHTAKWIFDECIMGPLMEGRTCILATHNIALCLSRSQYVVVLENGKIAAQGTPEEVIASRKLEAEVFKDETRSPTVVGELPIRKNDSALKETVRNVTTNGGGNSLNADESRAVGSLNSEVVILYLRSMGPWWFWLQGTIIFVLQPLSGIASNFWIRKWANQYGSRPLDIDVKYNSAMFALIGLGRVLVTLSRSLWTVSGSLAAASHIHRILIKSVYRATFSFYDSIPLGQLMNRFSEDLTCVDREVAFIAATVKGYAVDIIIQIVLISAVIPWFLVATAFISGMYFWVAISYIPSARDLKRLESVQRSPLFQKFGEVCNGVVTIRAYGKEQQLIDELYERSDEHTRVWNAVCAVNRWFSLRLEIVGAFVTFFTGAFIISRRKTIDAGLAGLILSSAIGFTATLIWLVRYYVILEQDFNSVERIKEYLDIKQETDSPSVPPPNWPSQGSIEFFDYTGGYRADVKSVQGINFKINPRERIGVVGRTGAGKSSLLQALIRVVECQNGKILIDNVDVRDVPLQRLRSSIAFLPQDPILFTGTIRSNLDPFGDFSDEELLTSLRRVRLIGDPNDTEPSLPVHALEPVSQLLVYTSAPKSNTNVFSNLSTPVTELGSNLSQGQRQLLCLARALVKNSKILLIDEATASIDCKIDAEIQETIRSLECTILAVAHRLETIIEYDKILVLDGGKVVESGDAYNLLRKEGEGAYFRNMCEETGNLESLHNAAKRAHDARKLVDFE